MKKKRKPKKKRTINQLKSILKNPFKPRAGILPTKINKDNSKYDRKDKHKKDLKNEAD